MSKSRILAATAVLLAFASGAAAQDSGMPTAPAATVKQGNSDDQAACRPDVRKFCRSLRQGASDMEFLGCLQQNRAKLSKGCRTVLESHGQ